VINTASGTSEAMRELLKARNKSLSRDFESLALALDRATGPQLLLPYQKRLREECQHWRNVIGRNFRRLRLPQDDILEDVLSDTQQATIYCRLISERMAAPVLRASDDDSLGLRLTTWMHSTHPRTVSVPAAFAEGGVAVYTFLVVAVAALYYIPRLVQRSLLYLPLYFHEFGHVLYRLHKQEMDDLVREIQQKVDDTLKPRSRRNDSHADAQASHRRQVMTTWYKWAQELFCDAVGLEMGGPAYLFAFSNYLGFLTQGDFYLPPVYLGASNHPVTLLRIRFLVQRAKSLGLTGEARVIEKEWATVAATLGVTEDYHGFYEETLADPIQAILNDMLTEADPRRFLPEEASPPRDWQPGDSPVFLFNNALRKAQADPPNYTQWGDEAIEKFLSESLA
jgi:hypothetical protein